LVQYVSFLVEHGLIIIIVSVSIAAIAAGLVVYILDKNPDFRVIFKKKKTERFVFPLTIACFALHFVSTIVFVRSGLLQTSSSQLRLSLKSQLFLVLPVAYFVNSLVALIHFFKFLLSTGSEKKTTKQR